MFEVTRREFDKQLVLWDVQEGHFIGEEPNRTWVPEQSHPVHVCPKAKDMSAYLQANNIKAKWRQVCYVIRIKHSVLTGQGVGQLKSVIVP